MSPIKLMLLLLAATLLGAIIGYLFRLALGKYQRLKGKRNMDIKQKEPKVQCVKCNLIYSSGYLQCPDCGGKETKQPDCGGCEQKVNELSSLIVRQPIGGVERKGE